MSWGSWFSTWSAKLFMFISIDTAPPASVAGVKARDGRFFGLSFCLAATLIASALADRRTPDTLAHPLDTIDRTIGEWTVAEQQTWPASIVAILRPTSYMSRTYTRQGRQLNLFIAYYAQQRAGESMHSPSVCLPGSGWDIVSHGTTDIRLDGKPVALNQYRVQNSGRRMLVIYWYQSRSRIITNEYLGKVALLKDALTGGYTSGSIVRILLPDDAAAVQEGADFARDLIPQVQLCFGAR